MNLFIMNLDEILAWYKPQNDNEKYILEVVRDANLIKEDSNTELVSLEERLSDAEYERNKFEDELDDANLDIDRLTNEIQSLENTIDGLETKLEDVRDELSDIHERHDD